MSNKDNGGPAFPFGQTDSVSGQLVNGWGSKGMTLRDYFAAKANESDVSDIMESSSIVLTRQQARYIHADRMLQEREK